MTATATASLVVAAVARLVAIADAIAIAIAIVSVLNSGVWWQQFGLSQIWMPHSNMMGIALVVGGFVLNGGDDDCDYASGEQK